MKRVRLAAVTLAIMMTASVVPAYAGEWKQDAKGYWYQNNDGGFPTNCWQEIDGKQYYFGSDGYMLANTTTPDGKQVGADGALISSRVYDNSSYQSILDWYSWKLKEATPQLIKEYKEEAKKNIKGVNGLAEICLDKVGKLADITLEGAGAMAELYMNSGTGKYSEYMEWASKLNAVYMEEGAKINKVYMDSAM